jgi:hypothetical protein
MSQESFALDRTTLAMALVGYELEKSKIEERIRELRARIGGGTSKTQGATTGMVASDSDAQPKRRKFSAAARKRMAAAQRKRWADRRKQKVAA